MTVTSTSDDQGAARRPRSAGGCRAGAASGRRSSEIDMRTRATQIARIPHSGRPVRRGIAWHMRPNIAGVNAPKITPFTWTMRRRPYCSHSTFRMNSGSSSFMEARRPMTGPMIM